MATQREPSGRTPFLIPTFAAAALAAPIPRHYCIDEFMLPRKSYLMLSSPESHA